MHEITMPPGGQTTDESFICKWHKNPGDRVERGDVLFEIETDKTTLEVESFCAGYLRSVKYGEGETAATGEIVAYVGEIDEPLPQADAPAKTGQEAKIEPRFAPKVTEKPKIAGKNRVLASPLAKMTAARNGLELKNIIPSSSSGVIKKQDVTSHIEKAAKKESAAVHRFSMVEADVGPCVLFLDRLNAWLGNENMTVGLADAITKCVALAIEKLPSAKPIFEGDRMARAIDGASQKSLVAIARENAGFESDVIEIGPIREKAVSVNREIKSRDMVEITVWFDRREADSATIWNFLAEVRKLLESPELLALNMAK